jgi:hypothetical protein
LGSLYATMYSRARLRQLAGAIALGKAIWIGKPDAKGAAAMAF